MKRKGILTIFFSLFLIQFQLLAQNVTHNKDVAQIITLKEFYNNEAVIFTESFTEFRPIMNEKYFTPTIEDIIAAEIMVKDTVTRVFKDDEALLKRALTNMRTYGRQYFGNISETNEKIIYVVIFSSHHYRSKSRFKNWRTEFIFGTGPIFGIHARIIICNVSQNKITQDSDPLTYHFVEL